jgi:hypothetical protein
MKKIEIDLSMIWIALLIFVILYFELENKKLCYNTWWEIIEVQRDWIWDTEKCIYKVKWE